MSTAPDARRPRLLYLAFFYPPSRASGVFRSLATANYFARNGWEVTVLAGPTAFFETVAGDPDEQLLDSIDPTVTVVRPPMRLPDAATDKEDRRGPLLRATARAGSRILESIEHRVFPEKYTSWSYNAYRVGLSLGRRQRFNLVLATGNPFSSFAAARSLATRLKAPYVLDYRDSWTLDLFTNEAAFPTRHPANRWERRFMASASAIAFVNSALRDWHARRYPEAADRMLVVPNGWDPDFLDGSPQLDCPAEDSPDTVTFSYIGTLTAQQPIKRMVAGIRTLRARENAYIPRLHLYGHLGYFAKDTDKIKRKLGIDRSAAENSSFIEYMGAVSKSAISDAYARSDVLVFLAGGSRYVTSGKIFEYMATGKPIVSVHKNGSAAEEYLQDYPLWFKPASLEPDDVAKAMAQAAAAAWERDAELVERSKDFARQFSRDASIRLLEQACRRISSTGVRPETGARIGPGAEPSP